MAIAEQLEKTFKDPTPFYAVLGAGDLAVKKLREVTTEAQERIPRTADVRGLPDKAQAAMSDVVSQAFETYTDLANRGRELLTKMRDQPASEEFADTVDQLDDQVGVTMDTAMDAAAQATDVVDDATGKVGQ